MRVAAIDLGSNSFHMLIAEIRGPSSFEVVVQEKMMIQLGKHTLLTGRLDAKTMSRGLRCLQEFRRLALARRVEKTFAVATSAIREAENGEEFLDRIRLQCGMTTRCISGKEEARLIHLAVSHHVDIGRRKALLIDIGGGSIELTVGDGTVIFFSTSAKLGFLRLQGRFVSSDPMSRCERARVFEYTRAQLQPALQRIARFSPETIIGTSGTMTTLLRLATQRRGASEANAAAADGVTLEEIAKIISDLLEYPTLERARLFDLDPLRAEYLPTALLALQVILQGVVARRLEFCPVALREGLIYDYLATAKLPSKLPETKGDLRLEAVLDLARRCDYPREHSHQVARLAGLIFRQTAALHGLGDREACLLEYGAILHDIGYYIGYTKHHKHAYYLVMNCDLRGFTPAERAVLGNLVRYHRRATPKNSHEGYSGLDAKAKRTVRFLTGILRIADGLDRSHFSIVEIIQCRLTNSKARFKLTLNPTRSDAALDLWAAKKHARYFEKIFGVEARFVGMRQARKTSSRQVLRLAASR